MCYLLGYVNRVCEQDVPLEFVDRVHQEPPTHLRHGDRGGGESSGSLSSQQVHGFFRVLYFASSLNRLKERKLGG